MAPGAFWNEPFASFHPVHGKRNFLDDSRPAQFGNLIRRMPEFPKHAVRMLAECGRRQRFTLPFPVEPHRSAHHGHFSILRMFDFMEYAEMLYFRVGHCFRNGEDGVRRAPRGRKFASPSMPMASSGKLDGAFGSVHGNSRRGRSVP